MSHPRDDSRRLRTQREVPACPRGKAAVPASPLRYYGGLQLHARQIAEMLPPHDRYAEPFGGGMSVLLSKPESATECVSDINPDLVNFWRVVQRPVSRRRLIDLVELTPYSRAVFEECVRALENGERDAVRRAWSLLVTCNQGRNGHGVREGSWAYEKGVANKKADSWAGLPARLEQAGRRLRRVRIECLPYQETLQRCSAPETVVLLDPPYVPSTRGAANVYLHEFSRKEHQCLLRIVGKLKKQKVILCGYRHQLYDTMLDGWRRTDFRTKSYAASRARGSRRDERVLSVWTNFVPHV